jgi:general stress protein 26
MNETAGELTRLQELMDASFARSSAHLQKIMTPDRRLTAARLCADLTGIAVLNVATVTANGEPRISALDGHFLHARWYATTADSSAKARQLQRRPAISAAYTPRDGYGVFAHGTARFLEPASPEFDALTEHCVSVYGEAPQAWGPDVVYLAIDASWFVGFAMTDADLAEIEARQDAR